MTTTPQPGAAGDDERIGYGEALAELDRILVELDDERLDIDILGDRVARAATLISICRDRLAASRLQVERIVADLDGPAPSGQEEEPPAPAGPPSDDAD